VTEDTTRAKKAKRGAAAEGVFSSRRIEKRGARARR
jgi:hypothetical protein